MEGFIQFISNFLLGFISCLVFTKGIIKITVHHINENVVPTLNQPDLKELEQQMLDEKPNEQDDLYDTKAIMSDVIDTMGGSDRL
jgi:hypothetical protein